jgi:predicted molibdopterin-dependent oxidoreductase YjgC
VHVFISGEQANARGAESLGLVPRGSGLAARGILEAGRDGNLGALAIFGANPVLHYPDRPLVEAALDAVPFVVVSELFMTETAALADLILPACAVFEKSGTTTDLAGDILPVMGAVVAPGETQADGDMLVLLAQALGIAVPEPAHIEAAVRAAVAQTPAERVLAARAPADGDLRLVLESTIFSGGGTAAFDARIAGLRTQPRVTLNPQTAAALQLADGELADVAAADGAALNGLRVTISPLVPPGAVAIVDGLPEAPANAIAAGGGVRVTAARTAAGAGV